MRKKKKRETCIGEREKLRLEKKRGQIWVRERKLVKKIAPISQNFPLLNYSPLLHQKNLM